MLLDSLYPPDLASAALQLRVKRRTAIVGVVLGIPFEAKNFELGSRTEK